MNFQAIFSAPCAKLGIRCTDVAMPGIEFLTPRTGVMPPRNALAQKACAQLEACLADADFCFDLPLALAGTEHQHKVWQAMRANRLRPKEMGQGGRFFDGKENGSFGSRFYFWLCLFIKSRTSPPPARGKGLLRP